MLARIRAFAKSWVALVLLGLLIVSFAIFGMQDVFAPRGGDWVLQAGGRTVSGGEFKSVFDNYRTQLAQQQGRPVETDEAVNQGLHLRILEELATGQAFAEQMKRLGIKPADPLVTDQIREFQGFFSPVSGAFDRDTYVAELARQGLTPERFESELRDSVAQQHFVSAVAAGVRAPRVFGASAAAFESEMRDVSMALVHPGLVERPAPPTDAQLTAFMQENASRLRRPEQRALTVVRFNAADAARTAVVDPAEVQRQFNFRRDTLSRPERRTFVQIPAADRAQAAQAAQRLRAGEDPAAVARALGREPVAYADSPRTAVTDRRVAEAAFALPQGQVSDPVEGELGWSVVKVAAITPAVQASLEQARPQIEAELRANAAEQQVTAQVEKYETARDGGANLVEAARQAGVSTLSLAPVTQDGRSVTGPPAALEPALLQAAFEGPAGTESEVIEISQGQYAAVRVDRVIPPSLPGLEEIRAPLTGAWLTRELQNRIRTRAQGLAATVRKSGNVEAAARALNAPFTRVPGLTRAGGAQTPQEVLAQAFSTKPREVFTTDPINTPAGPLGVAVGRVEAVRFPPAPVMAAGLDQRVTALSGDLLQDMGEMVRKAARIGLRIRTNPDRALAALGISPDQVRRTGEAESGGPASGGVSGEPAAR